MDTEAIGNRFEASSPPENCSAVVSIRMKLIPEGHQNQYIPPKRLNPPNPA